MSDLELRPMDDNAIKSLVKQLSDELDAIGVASRVSSIIGDRKLTDSGEPARSDAREIQCIKAAWQSEWETVSEYEAVLRDFGYDFEDSDDCIDWLRGRLTARENNQ